MLKEVPATIHCKGTLSGLRGGELFHSQGFHWIDGRCPPRRNDSRDESCRNENPDGYGHHDGIDTCDVVQLRFHEADAQHGHRNPNR